jgi:hypothetical protein
MQWSANERVPGSVFFASRGIERRTQLSFTLCSMPRTIKLDRLPAGFALTNMLPDDSGAVEACGFHTSDEGPHFTKLLEGCEDYLRESPAIRSSIDHLLAIVTPEREATVYINELTLTAKAQAARSIRAGEAVMLDDLADIISFDLGVVVPPSYGVFFMFSWRWRRGLFFDYTSFHKTHQPRQYDLGSMLAACHCRLIFAERFSLSDEEWSRMFSAGWFPFVGIKSALTTEVITHVKNCWDLSRLDPQLIAAAKAAAREIGDGSALSPIFREHTKAIKTAIRQFEAGDCLSAAHILYPKIEGVLREYYRTAGSPKTPSQRDFINAATAGAMVGRHGYCLLLLARFDDYLRRVIFGPFDPSEPQGITRHTIAHGLVSDCDEKHVALALLTLQHLYYSLNQSVAASA